MAKIRLFINNFIAIFVFYFLKYYFSVMSSKPVNKKDFLLVNLGQIGDLSILSTVIDSYIDIGLSNNVDFLINEKYLELFKYLVPNANIKTINIKKYSSNIFYRIQKVSHMRLINYQKVINLTSFNRIMTDEIVLLQNAGEYYCLKNNWNSLRPFFRKIMVNKYTGILGCEEVNEYKRHFEVFKKFFNKDINSIVLSKKEKLNGNKYFEKYIVISSTTSQKISAWDINNFTELIRLLIVNFNVILLGDKLINKLEDITSAKFLNLSGKTTIVKAVNIIKNCDLYIGNDSGLTHIAIKYGVPIICILGGGAFNFYFPIFESENTKYIYKKLDCFNCDWYCKYQEPKCLTEISVGEVYNEALKILNRVYV